MLRPGGSGEAVRDLQRRLVALGHPIPPAETGSFGPATERELRAFQDHRALRVDGICGPETWTALVESGFQLGDRMLYVRRPMLRGDDVVELQRRLNTLGFDAGKEDGIFGPDTAGALTEFQRNAGLGCDGIFGPDTAESRSRASVPSASERWPSVRLPASASGRRCAAGPIGSRAVGYSWPSHRVSVRWPICSCEVCSRPVRRSWSTPRAVTTRRWPRRQTATTPTSSSVSGPARSPGCRCSYYASGEFRSEAGYRVATAVSSELSAVLDVDVPTLRTPPHGAARDEHGRGALRTHRARRRSRDAPPRHPRRRRGPRHRGGDPPRCRGTDRARSLGGPLSPDLSVLTCQS